MKITSKIILSIAFVVALFGFTSQKADAGTYKIGNYTFTATHCNAQNVCHDPSKAEAANVFAYAIGAGKMTYTHNMSCGNTVKLVIKSCKVSNACKDGNQVSLDAKCKRTTTACECGCSAGTCNDCEPPICEDGDPECDPLVCEDGDPECDPGLCDEDIWSCGDWSSCSNGISTRSCVMLYNCPNANTPMPDTSMTCTNVPPTVIIGPDGNPVPPACQYPAADGSCPPPTISFSANPKLISKGGSCKLNWNVSGAEECKISDIVVSPTKGTKSVSPETTTAYKITCKNGPGIASKVALCSVQDVIEQ